MTLDRETQDITSSDIFHAIAIVQEVYYEVSAELTNHTFDPSTPLFRQLIEYNKGVTAKVELIIKSIRKHRLQLSQSQQEAAASRDIQDDTENDSCTIAGDLAGDDRGPKKRDVCVSTFIEGAGNPIWAENLVALSGSSGALAGTVDKWLNATGGCKKTKTSRVRKTPQKPKSLQGIPGLRLRKCTTTGKVFNICEDKSIQISDGRGNSTKISLAQHGEETGCISCAQ